VVDKKWHSIADPRHRCTDDAFNLTGHSLLNKKNPGTDPRIFITYY
jgi:hypothetical protein